MINKVSKKELGRFRHFILYAKGHYGNIYENYIQKLKAILAYSTGGSYKKASIGNLKTVLSDILQDCYQERTLICKLRNMTLLNKERFLKQCISKLDTLRTKKDGETYIELGEINPKLKETLDYIDKLNRSEITIKPIMGQYGHIRCNHGHTHWKVGLLDFSDDYKVTGTNLDKTIKNAQDTREEWIAAEIQKKIKNIF